VSAFRKFFAARKQYHDDPRARRRDPDNTATASPMQFSVVAWTNPKPEFGLLQCIVAPRHRANRRLEFTPAVFHETDSAGLIGCAGDDDRSQSWCIAADMLNVLWYRIGVARLTALLLGCPSGLQSRCSVDWRVISEVEVEGKIKANGRLLEAFVCTLVLEMWFGASGFAPAKPLFLLPPVRRLCISACIRGHAKRHRRHEPRRQFWFSPPPGPNPRSGR
jgi:hypothetical protein